MIIAQIAGALFGLLSVVLGAFGAHALKGKFTEQQLVSYETGVKYQMYHAIVLLILGYLPLGQVKALTVWFFIFGTLLFSGSIYLLCYTGYKGNKWKFLGPVTPLGGLLLVVGWALLLYNALVPIFV
ncbi:DUF423 domain-containing protein [Neptunitalea lumnitzerae]|uniref:Membrane protein n=1 Tax=Neptunitalea lumnitzerae TaxID=2965509 RepID=A0ABQ5MGE4_9FLAO|nr:DUF423 domain-containing protein [Neptunitalea sp. Y10]GLB48480.1 membrane protein [Neptunitalea sp. Y10]